jgi:hypothetical protein
MYDTIIKERNAGRYVVNLKDLKAQTINHIQKNHPNLYYYMKNNNLIYSYTVETWSNIRLLYNWHGEIIFEMFNKYTLKQQNTIYILEENYPRRIYTVRIWHKYPDLYIFCKPQIRVGIQDVHYIYKNCMYTGSNMYK